MYYITVSIIVILWGGCVNGEDHETHGYYTDSSVNGPPAGNYHYYTVYCSVP